MCRAFKCLLIARVVAAGVFLYVVSSVLGLLVSPLIGNILVYILFFGYYPIVKGIMERIKLRPVEWVLKILVFNAALTAAEKQYWKGL